MNFRPDPYGLKLHYKSSGRMLNGPFLNHIYPQPYFDKKSPFAEDSVPKHGLYLDREKANQNKKKNETSWIPNGPAKSVFFKQFLSFIKHYLINNYSKVVVMLDVLTNIQNSSRVGM